MEPLLILFVVLIVFMFFSSRKARKQQQEKATFQSELAPGQEVLTASGLLGTVTGVDGDIVTLEHAPGSTTTWLRAAIARPYEPPVEDDEDVEDVEEPEDATVSTENDEDGPSTPGLLDKP
ncbi:MAG: preprotein translocase subunit YajC [Actinomycetales bacterium]|nr:preprotein translocase subunit YajC [Actinomycetales bacterium]